ncbi:hypothetical protein AMTRI_Chr09g17990 [Amborella trichopoda]
MNQATPYLPLPPSFSASFLSACCSRQKLNRHLCHSQPQLSSLHRVFSSTSCNLRLTPILSLPPLLAALYSPVKPTRQKPMNETHFPFSSFSSFSFRCRIALVSPFFFFSL